MSSSKIPFAEPPFHTLPSPYFNSSHHRLREAVREWIEEHLMGQAFEWEEGWPMANSQSAKQIHLVV